MRNIKINEAESIIEAFWDVGESYPDNHKYNILNDYRVVCDETAGAKVSPQWSGVSVISNKSIGERPFAVLEQKLAHNLRTNGADKFILFAAIENSVKVKIVLQTDKGRIIAIDTYGMKGTNEYTGEIKGSSIFSVRLEFYGVGAVWLFWMGLQNSERIGDLTAPSDYDSEWRGCLNDDFEIEPELNIYFNKDELEILRKKMNSKYFKVTMDKFRKEAVNYMNTEPEKEIGEFFPFYSARFQRERDKGRVQLFKGMEALAFVGVIDKNKEMLRMACRMALCAAHSKYWCESIMGVFPGATWHHRSFTEFEVCRSIAMVLDWAGKCLTWHGKNIIYDAIIMKGLPRINADFKTMDYIYECNQSFMFSVGRIAALIALVKRYPRYEREIQEAENDLFEAIEKTVCDDGGSLEGIAYWSAILTAITHSIFLLARYRGKRIKDYINEKTKKIPDYGLAMLRDMGGECRFLPVSDAAAGGITGSGGNSVVCAYSYILSGNKEWLDIYNLNMSRMPEFPINNIEASIIAPYPEPFDGEISDEQFISLNACGQTKLVTTDKKLGRIHLHLSGGSTYFSHTHGDKGSFMLEVNGNLILTDPGMVRYDMPEVQIIRRAERHNVFMPVSEQTIEYDQEIFNCDGARVIKSEIKNGLLAYSTDVTGAWEKNLFSCYVRNVNQQSKTAFIVEDKAEYVTPHSSYFQVNTYGAIERKDNCWLVCDKDVKVIIRPLDYIPEKAEISEVGIGSLTDENGEYMNMRRLRLMIPKAKCVSIQTLIEVC